MEILIKISFVSKSFEELILNNSFSSIKVYFEKAGVRLLHCFGDYHLNKFNNETSERLILIFH